MHTAAIVLDGQGYVQLLDLRYASKADPTPSDFCGYAHYLSPEQVSGMATEARVQTGGAQEGGIVTQSRISGELRREATLPFARVPKPRHSLR